jgi:hypothetical protein
VIVLHGANAMRRMDAQLARLVPEPVQVVLSHFCFLCSLDYAACYHMWSDRSLFYSIAQIAKIRVSAPHLILCQPRWFDLRTL